MDNPVLEVDRTAVGETRVVDALSPSLEVGEVRLRIDHFAVTANNVTYAVFGDVLAYWEFFPTDLPWGRVPAMGWAEIVESANEDLEVGSRFYGWYPMAAETTILATATADGFRDDGPHRQPHAPVYRSYVDTRHDVLHDPSPDGEDRHSLLRGLFLTGFLAEEFFADSGGTVDDGADVYFGAEQVVVLSASSKTAIGFAQRAKARGAVRVVGVTSGSNRNFVEGLGYYDSVCTYDEIDGLDAEVVTVAIDMAGNPTVLGAVHERFGDQLAHSMTVGRSHHDAAPPEDQGPLAGPTPQMFFAPTEVTRRLEQWGRAEYSSRSASALAEFVEGSREWLTVEHRRGPEGATSAWSDVHAGTVPPNVGLVVSLSSA